MSLMSSSMVSFTQANLFTNKKRFTTKPYFNHYMSSLNPKRKPPKKKNLIPFAKYNKKKPWWQTILSDGGEDEDEILESNSDLNSETESETEKFEAWRLKAEAIIELREAQEDAKNEDRRYWEDWVSSEGQNGNFTDWDWRDEGNNGGNGGNGEKLEEIISEGPKEIIRDKDIFETINAIVNGDEQDLLFEDRVFKYASINSVKFIALLILIPSVVGFVVHDYVLMPFLDRYVEKVPLAAELLDLRRSQKLRLVHELKVESAKFRLEVEIGQSPPLSEEDIFWELRHKAIELRDEWRLENRKTFANIFSDMVNGIVLFLLIYFNESKVALLKFTGYKVLNNVTDAGKAFFIISIADVMLGYHSEVGWAGTIEILLDRYGLEVDQAAIDIFIFVVPIALDTFVKLWIYQYLPRMSRNVAQIIEEVERH